MGISYGDGGSECESYLSINYGISLFSQSSGFQLYFLLTPLIIYTFLVTVIFLTFSSISKVYFPTRYAFYAINMAILYSSYFFLLFVI